MIWNYFLLVMAVAGAMQEHRGHFWGGLKNFSRELLTVLSAKSISSFASIPIFWNAINCASRSKFGNTARETKQHFLKVWTLFATRSNMSSGAWQLSLYQWHGCSRGKIYNSALITDLGPAILCCYKSDHAAYCAGMYKAGCRKRR